MTHKDYKHIIKQVESSRSGDDFSYILKKITDIVIDSEKTLDEDKLRVLFLYVQYRNEYQLRAKQRVFRKKDYLICKRFKFRFLKKKIYISLFVKKAG